VDAEHPGRILPKGFDRREYTYGIRLYGMNCKKA
jgi:hypothetical protein